MEDIKELAESRIAAIAHHSELRGAVGYARIISHRIGDIVHVGRTPEVIDFALEVLAIMGEVSKEIDNPVSNVSEIANDFVKEHKAKRKKEREGGL